ncbi:MAG: replicative DNA helicase [Myxococcota bacterium]
MTEFPSDPGPAPLTDGGMTLPHAIEAEKEILAAVLLDNLATDVLIEHGIVAESFYVPRHQLIYASMRTLYDAHEAIDEVTLPQQMKDANTFDKAGGYKALSELLSRSGTTANLNDYCKIVRQKAAVRRMIDAARKIEADAFQAGEDVEGFLDTAERSVFAVLEDRALSNLRPVADVVRGAIQQISAAYDSDESITGIGTGFRDLDKITNGLQRGDLIIVAARPAMGKTSFVLNLASNAALKHDASVAIFSLEMPAEQLASRLLSAEARIDLSRLRGGYLREEDWPKLTNAADLISRARIHIDDTPGITPASVRAKCRRLARSTGIDLVVIDYLQLMNSSDNQRSREQEISMISRSLKGLAKDLSCPVIALSQLNRGPETRTDHRPMMADLRESGAIEQDADLVSFIYREAVYNQELDEAERGIAEFIIGKHRNGATGTVKLKFWNAWTRFDNLAEED